MCSGHFCFILIHFMSNVYVSKVSFWSLLCGEVEPYGPPKEATNCSYLYSRRVRNVEVTTLTSLLGFHSPFWLLRIEYTENGYENGITTLRKGYHYIEKRVLLLHWKKGITTTLKKGYYYIEKRVLLQYWRGVRIREVFVLEWLQSTSPYRRFSEKDTSLIRTPLFLIRPSL